MKYFGLINVHLSGSFDADVSIRLLVRREMNVKRSTKKENDASTKSIIFSFFSLIFFKKNGLLILIYQVNG